MPYRYYKTAKRRGVRTTDLVLGFVNVEDVDDGAEVAHDVVVSAHVGRRDAAHDVVAQAPVLLDGQVVERVRRAIVEQAKRVRAVVVLQRSDVVVAMRQRRAGTDLHPRQTDRHPFTIFFFFSRMHHYECV